VVPVTVAPNAARSAKCASASAPRLPAQRPRNIRRDSSVATTPREDTGLLQVKNRVAGEQHLAQVAPSSLLPALLVTINLLLRRKKALGGCPFCFGWRPAKRASKRRCQLCRLVGRMLRRQLLGKMASAGHDELRIQQAERLERHRRARPRRAVEYDRRRV